jgi:hypothetical protein
LHARRLVAQRCLYGVDKNPLATSMALKLWAIERKNHIMALVADEGLALFCGLNAMPGGVEVIDGYASAGHEIRDVTSYDAALQMFGWRHSAPAAACSGARNDRRRHRQYPHRRGAAALRQ